MTNDVTRPLTGTEIDPYAEYAGEVNTRPFVGDLLIFTKHGQYKAGQDRDEIAMATKMLVYMPGLKRGWVKWQEGQPVAHIMGLVAEGFRPPPREELGDDNEDEWELLNDKPRDPWQTTNHLPMCNQKGEVFTFVSSSKGGLSEVGRLSELYSNRRRMKPDEIPVIELESRSYDHKLYGETLAPVFKVVGWVPVPQTFSELSASVDEGSDETLVLEDLMKPATQKPAAKTAPVKAAPQKPAAKSAPVKPPPPRTTSSRGGSSSRRSPRLG